MSLQNTISNKDRQMAVDAALEEACRQWCDTLSDAPERMNGEGFANFFYEIFQDKQAEYIRDAKELRSMGSKNPERPKEKPSVLRKLQEKKNQDTHHSAPTKNKQSKHEVEL